MQFPFRKLAFAVAILSVTTFSADSLKIWIMPNGAAPQEKLEERLNQFSKKTGITTKVTVLDWGEAWTRISYALNSQNDAPDVVQLGTTWVAYFANHGKLMPLNNYLDKIDSSRFISASWNTTKIDGDSVIYSVPWFIDIRPLLANKRLMKKYGISKEDVETLDGFTEALKKVNQGKEILDDGTKVRGYAFPGKSDWNIPHNFASWIWSNGGDFIAKDQNGKWHANILSEPTLTGIAKYLGFITDSIVSIESLQSNSAQIAQQFNNGELAFIISTAEVIMQTRFEGSRGGLSNARIGTDSVIALPVPKGRAGSISFIGGSNLAIPASNKNPNAIKLLLYLTEDENLDAYTKQIGFLPPSKNILNPWSEDEIYKGLVEQLETGRTYTTIPEWSDIEQALVSMFSVTWEQMEIPSLYSTEKLYQIFKEYSEVINKRLDYTPTNIMTLAEFETIWNKNIGKKDQNTKNKDENIKNGSGINPTPFIFLFVFIISFLFSYTRKRTK